MSTDDFRPYDREEPALSDLERSVHDAVDAPEPWALVERFADIERVSGSPGELWLAREAVERVLP